MIRLAQVVETFHDAFLAQYGARLTGVQWQALAAMRRCRRQASAVFEVACTACVSPALRAPLLRPSAVSSLSAPRVAAVD